jgi:hypothetical protein
MTYTSSSLAGIQAAVAAGMGLRILCDPGRSFAPIDRTEVALVAAPEASPATLRLADRLAEFCNNVRAKAA